MRKYDFDKVIPRANTNCIKYDVRQAVFGNPNVLPMWVADMDFQGSVLQVKKSRPQSESAPNPKPMRHPHAGRPNFSRHLGNKNA